MRFEYLVSCSKSFKINDKTELLTKGIKNMKKKLLFFVTITLLGVASAFAQIGGTTGPLTWELNSGTLTISGDGAMPDYSYGEAPWYDYRFSIFTVVIGNGVTSIGNLAFYGCQYIPSITIPNSVATIGDQAFSSCSSLASITIPNSVTIIGNYTFNNCQTLTSITIPNSVIIIGTSPFQGCTKLAVIEVESGNANYSSDNGVLFDKEKTILICCPAGKANNYTIPNGVIFIENGAFLSCSALTSIVIPNSVTTIRNNAFYNCSALTSVTIPNSVTTIGAWAFGNCTALTSVTIPNSVTTIENFAFHYCTALNAVTILNIIPIEIEPYVFLEVNIEDVKLRVPALAVSAYDSATVWQDFNIIGLHELSVAVNINEYGNATGGGWYEINDAATVTATAFNGYEFTNWTKDGVEISINNPYSFTVMEDMELVANFNSTSVHISGKILRPDQTTLSSGIVSLYKVQTLSQYILVDAVPIENNGSYLFTDVQQGGYIMKVAPQSIENALPTYYGNTEMWNEASLIIVANTSLSNLDITVIPMIEISEGSSAIDGYVVEEGSGKSKSPVEDAVIYLLTFQNNIWATIFTTNSDENGYFEFGKLPAGKYMTIVDAPGLKMLNTIPLDIGATDTIKIVFTITDEGIKTDLGNVDISPITWSNFKIYPNPTNGQLTIESGELVIENVDFFDIVGR